MDPERSAAAQYRVSLTHQIFPRTRVLELLDNGPVVVAGVTGLGKDFYPTLWKIMKFRREHPTLEDLLLLGRQIGVNLDESPPATEALDFAHRSNCPRPRKVVDGIE